MELGVKILARGHSITFFKGSVKIGNGIKTALKSDIDHFQVGCLRKIKGKRDAFCHNIFSERNTVRFCKPSGKRAVG